MPVLRAKLLDRPPHSRRSERGVEHALAGLVDGTAHARGEYAESFDSGHRLLSLTKSTAEPYNEFYSLVSGSQGDVMTASEQAASTPRMDAELSIEYSKIGGVAGIHVELALSEFDGTLTPEDAEELGQLLDEVDFFNVKDDAEPSTMTDQFIYTITAARGRRRRTLRAETGSGSELLTKLGPLLAWLDDRAPSPFPRVPLT